ncbi:hypothetical protein ACP3V9_24555, partial [Salmonella enterica]|uniref:hypothetical protein n=1 Tax=Salmonella enterica TaxID=28901 RepID=UPI003CF562C2
MGHLTPLPELDYSDISQFSHKSPPKAPKEPKAAPVVKPATPVQTPKEAPAPKVDKGLYDFNVKGIVSRYEKILVLLNEIS